MQKYCHIVYRLFATVVAFTAFSTLCAQSSVTTQTTYYSGNGATIVSDCRIVFNSVEQSKTACKDANDAAFDITFNYGADTTWYFWWPSLKGKVPKNDISLWFEHSSTSTATTFTVPSGTTWTHGGFGTADVGEYLYVYSTRSQYIDSIEIDAVTVFPLFNPGAIATSSSTVCPGGASLINEDTAPSGGSGTYTYEWYKGSEKINLATTNTYTPAAETATGAYTYTRKVIDAQCGTLTSGGSYILTVVANPTVSIEKTGPGTATICHNTDGGTLTATLSPIAVGAPYTYAWQKWEEGATTWTEVSSETASTYAPGALTVTTAFRVSATGSSSCTTDFSTPATITVYPQFSAGAFKTGDDAAGTVCVNGQPAAITNAIQQTAPTGSGTYTYQWYRNGETSTPASVTEYFTPAAETATDAVTYTRKVFDATCSQDGMTAGSYILHVTPTPTESFTTTASTVCYNTSATLSITAPSGATDYAWASSPDGSMWSAATSTATSNSFTTGNLTVETFYQATVTVSNPLCPTVVSAAPATVSVHNQFAPGAITSKTYTICVDGTPEQIDNFTTALGGDEAIIYTWTYSFNGTASTITGSNNAAYTPPASSFTTAPGTYHFQRWAKDGACQSTYTVSANTYTLVVVENPSASITVTGAGTATICYNTDGGTLTATLSSGAAGAAPYTYAWQKWEEEAATWTEVSSGTPSTYASGSLTKTTAFRVSATGALGCAADFSTPSTITVNPLPEATVSASTICYNQTAALTATLGSGTTTAMTYTWDIGGTSSTTTDNSKTSQVLTATTTYTVQLTNSNGCVGAASAPATITVYDAFDAGEFLTTTGGTRVNMRPAAITGVSAPTGGGSAYTYKWYENAQEVGGATAATYWPPEAAASAVGEVVYTREVTETVCSSTSFTSGSYVLKVGVPPTTNIVPVDTAICNGCPFNLTSSTYSGGTYIWEKNTNGVSWSAVGSNDKTLDVMAESQAGTYYYKVTITTAAETITAAPATVTVYEPLSGGTFQITSGMVCGDEIPSTIYAGAPTGGSGSYTYQWYKDGTTEGTHNIPSATSKAYRPGVDAVGTYYRKVTDATCNASTMTSGSYVLTATTDDSPTTNLDPVVLTVCNGETITIATDAHATGTYTWYETDGTSDDTSIDGQTTNELSVSRSGASTYYYKVTIEGASTCGDIITSTPATVTVRGAFNAGTITDSGTICAGGTPAAITEATQAAGGDGNYSYRWYKDGQLIAGATAATYQPKAEDALTAGTVHYTREAKNGACATWTLSANTYTLTVTAAPTVSLQAPTTVTACISSDFSVAVGSPSTGTANSYAWEEYVNGAWTNVSGIAQTLTVSGGKSVAGDYYYRAKVTVDNGSDCTLDVYSNAATVTVREAFSAGTFQVTSGAICPDATPAAITGVSDPTGGDGTYTYQWYKDSASLGAGATAATYQPEAFSSATTAVYTREAKDGCTASPVAIGSYTLTVSGSVTSTINIMPAAQEICNNASFTVTSGEPAGATGYKWEASTDGVHWSTLLETTKKLDVTGKTQSGIYYYKVSVKTSSTCSQAVVSTPATVTVREAFNPGVFQVTVGAICPGATPAAITGVSDPTGGDGHYTYQWYKDGQPIDDATAAIYQPETFGSETTAVYTRGAKDGCAALTQAGSYTLTVSASATSTIDLIRASQGACNGLPFTLTTGVVTGALGYTWYSRPDNGATWSSVSGQTTGTLTQSGATEGTYYYKVEVLTGGTCSPVVVSAPATVTVYPAFSAGAFKPDAGGTVCVNGAPDAITSAIQEIAPTGSGSYTYEWYRNEDATVVATSEYFTPAPETATGAVTYTRKVISDCGSGFTAGSYILEVKSTPTVTLKASESTICYNATTIITASTVTGITPGYTWESSTNGATWTQAAGTYEENTLMPGSLTETTYYRVKVTVSDNERCPEQVSDAPATITVHAPFNPGAITSDTYTICAGGTPVQISSAATASGGDEDYTYLWTYSREGGAAGTVTGSNNAAYTPPASSFTTPGTYHFQRWAKDGTCQSAYTVSADTYTLAVLPAPSVTVQPATQVVCYGAAATFTVEVTNSTGSASTYTWEQKKASDVNWSNAGETYTNAFTSGTMSEETAFRVTLSQPGSGCTSTISVPATVTLNQETPVYMPPQNITVVTGNNLCTAVVTHDGTTIVLQGTYTATCPLDSLYYTISGATSFAGPKTSKVNLLTSHTFDKGASTVTYTVKTAGGHSTTSSFPVTVNDQQAPVITCGTKDVYLDASGQAGISDLSTLIATASDNCSSSATLVYQTSSGASAASFTCADLGVKHVTITAKDEAGNYSTECAATVTVHNEQPPVAVCKPKDTLYVSVNNGLLAASRLAAASSTVICGQPLAYYILNDALDTSPTNISKSFACTDGGTTHTIYVGVVNTVNSKMAVCSTEVLVTDTVLHCTPKAIDTLYLSSGCSYTLTPAIDGDLIPMSVATPYRGCQNVLRPVAGMTLINDKGFDIYQSPFSSPEFAAGTYEITWTLKDDFGDRATCKDVFAVVDTIRPTFTSAIWTEISRNLAPGSCTISVNWTIPEIADNCTGTLRRTDILGTPPLDLTAGTYLVKYVVEDASGNVSRDTAKIFITVIDQNSPFIAAIADTTMKVDNAADCFATVPAGGLRPVISNVCTTGMTVTYETDHAGTVTAPATTTAATGLGGVQFNVGATAVTYTVTAANSKMATATFTVTVQDTVKPVITCKSHQVRNYDSNGSYTVSGMEFDVAATDNCGGTVTLAATIDGGTATYSTLAGHVLSGASSFTVTWTATDVASNTATCNFTVTMGDTIPPVFTSFPDTIRVNTAPTACAATVTAVQLAAVYTDNVTPVVAIAVTHTLSYKGAETSGTGLLPDTEFRHDTTVVTYTITDVAGKSRDSSFLVIVIDSVPPVFTTCPDNITGLQIATPLSDCIASPTTLTAPTYSDNCSTVKTLSWSINGSRGAQDTSSNYGAIDINPLTSYQFAAGTNTVRYTAADASGNTAACSFTVEVADKVLPICESVSTYTLNLQAGIATILDAKRLDSGSADNCGTLTYRLSDASDGTFTCSDIGKTRTVYLVVSDDFGNENACVATQISVADTIAPVVTCKDTTVYLDAHASASLTAIDLETNATDNCTVAGQLQHFIVRADGTATTDTTFGCADVGYVYMLTVRVLDAYNKAGTCTSTVTVRDTLLNHRGKIVIPADPDACTATLSDTLNPSIVSGCSAVTLTNSAGTNTYAGMTLPVGTNYVTWTMNDGRGVKTVTDTIIVADKQKPVLIKTALKNITPSTVPGCTVTSVTWTEPEDYVTIPDTLAKDNCTDARVLTWHRVDTNQTRVINSSGTIPVGRWKIQYIAKDAADNESDTLSFFVIVTNNNVPVITCPGAAKAGKDTVFVDAGDCAATIPNRFTPTVTGLCPGADSLSYAYSFNGGSVTEGAGSLEDMHLPVGLYSVTYTVTNKFAVTLASATCAFALAVIDNENPTFTCPDNQSRTPDGLYYTVDGTEFDLTDVNDNCGIASATHNYGGGGTTLAGMQIPAGHSYTIQWKVVDVNGNKDSCAFVLTLGDKVKPDITINETPTVYLDAAGNGTLPKDSVIIHMSDNVTDSSAIVTTLTPNTFTCANIGTVPGTFTATDAAGNDTIKAITITVRDTVAPTFTLRNPTVYLNATGTGVLTLDSVIITLNDNCTPRQSLDTSLSRTAFTCSDIALSPITVTFMAKDGHNNERSRTVSVIVKDTIIPQFTCATGTAIRQTRPTDCNYEVNGTEFDPVVPAIFEGCGSYTFSHNYSGDATTLAGALLPAGLHAITWTVANLSGLTATCDVTVKVEDKTPPVFTTCPPPVSEIILTTGACTVTVSSPIFPAVSDNCMLDSLTWSIRCMGALRDSSGSVQNSTIPANYAFSSGTNVITYTAVDTSGNRNTCSFVVPVKATVPPTCNSVSAYTLNLQEPGVATLDPKAIDAGSTDNCIASGELRFDLASGSPDFTCADIGTPRMVVLRVTDVSGIRNTCISATAITVVDAIAPQVQCVADTTLYVDSNGEVLLSAAALNTGSSDYCSGTALTYSFLDATGTTYTPDTTFRCANLGTLNVTVAVADAYHNIGTCTVSVTVNDTLKPVIVNRGQITVPTTGVTGCVAVLSDTLNPVITPGSSCSTLSSVGYVVTNGGSGTTTYAGLSLSAGTHEITWTATADNGLTTTAKDTITVVDTLAPAVKAQMTDINTNTSINDCSSENEVYWTLPEAYPANTLVEDNCTAASALTWTRVDANQSHVVWGQNVSAGKWKIQYVAKDEAGHVSDTVGFVLTVVALQIPSLNFSYCPSGQLTLDIDAANVCYATVPATFTPAADACPGTDSLSYAYTFNGGAVTEGVGSLAGYQLPVGQYSATYTVFNITNPAQFATCAFEVKVRDTVPPVITKKDPITVAASPATLTLNDVLDAVTDNCMSNAATTVTLKNVTLGGEVFTCADNIGWIYAEDASGNKDSVSFSVTFNSSTPPTVTARDTTLYLDAGGSATLSAYEVVETVDDQLCMPASVIKDPANGLLTLSQTDFACGDVGTQTVTISAQGSAPTAGTATFTVTVADTLKPTITCASGASKMVDEAICSYKVQGTEFDFDPVSTRDNCSVRSVLHDYQGGGTTLADTLLPVGTHTITWTVTDASDSIATCEVVITVNDASAPEITCKPGQIAYLDNDGNATVDAKDLVDVTKECAPLTALTYSFEAYGAGTHTYGCSDTAGVRSEVIRVLDLSGNSSTCTAQFTVRDNLPPVIVLNDPIRLTASSVTGITPPITATDALNFTLTKDNCTAVSDLVVDIVPQVYGCSVTAGTVTVTDKQGLSSSSTFSVILDGIPRMSIIPQNPTLYRDLDANGAATLSAYDVVTNISDVCADVDAIMDPANGLITLSQSTFTCADIGAHTYTVFVRQTPSAAPETFTFNVTVSDITPPIISCNVSYPSALITAASCSYTVADDGWDISVSDNSSCTTLTNTWNNSNTLSGATFSIGTHTVTWTITDAGSFTASCMVTYTVEDKHAPDIITCMTDTLLVIDAGGSASITAQALVTATDCSPMSYTFATGKEDTTFSCGGIGTHTLAVTVTDSSGNKSSCNAQVRVADTVLLVTCKQMADTVYINANGDEITLRADSLVTATANCMDTLTYSFSSSAPGETTTFGCGTLGTHTVTVYVTNATAKQASCSMTVTVVDTLLPVITKKDPITVAASPATLTLTDVLDAVTDNCISSATVTFNNATLGGDVFTCADNLGWIYAEDASGNKDSVSFNVTFSLSTPPTVTARPDTLYLDADGKITLSAYDVVETVDDHSCIPESVFKDPANGLLTLSQTGFTCDDVGTHTVTISAQGSAQTPGTTTITVTVRDTLPPTFTLRNNATVYLDATGAATLTQTMVLETLRDNCTDSSNISVTFSRSVFYVDDMANSPIPVMVYVTDQWDNKDSVMVLVPVVDGVARETTIAKRIQGRDVANKGDTVTFIITVTNNFGSDRSLIVVDSLPAGLSLVEDRVPGNASVDLAKKVITINHGSLGEGATVSYTIVARVEQEGMWTNYARLYRAEKRIAEAEVSLNALQPELTLTAKIREGDYTNTEPLPAIYNVPDNYHLLVSLENRGGATVDRIDVRITYNPFVHQFAGSSRGAEVTDNGNAIIWTVHNFEGSLKLDLELMFRPLIAATYTFVNEITTHLPYEDPIDNTAWVTVNQAIIKVPNVVTSEYPDLYIKGMENPAIEEATMKVFNIWGNQVSYIRHRHEDIDVLTTSWFNAGNLARGTYYYVLVTRYQNGSLYTIRDYVEVLK